MDYKNKKSSEFIHILPPYTGITIDEHGIDFDKDQWSQGTKQEFNQRMQSLIDFYTKTFQVLDWTTDKSFLCWAESSLKWTK